MRTIERSTGGTSARRRIGAHPFTALAVLGLALGVFDFFSAGSSVAQRRLVSQKPPIYGTFEPGFSRWGIVALILVVVGGFGAVALSRRDRLRPALFLAIGVAFLLAFAAAVAAIGGQPKDFVEPLVRAGDYQSDVHFVHELGVRGFVENEPSLVPRLRAAHSKTHPPGPILLLWFLQGVFPDHVVPRALVLALLSALILVPTWFVAKKFAGERAAAYAVMFLAVAPAPAMFTFVSMDAVFATLIVGAAALLIYALDRDDPMRPAFVAGLAVGALTFMTYGIGWLLPGLGIYALVTRPFRLVLRWTLGAAAGVVVALLTLRLALGFDLLRAYRASYDLLQFWQDSVKPGVPTRSYTYWIFGNVGAWLTFAGLPIAALGLREMFLKRPAYLLAVFAPLFLLDFSRFLSAETERIAQFAFPFMAVGAAAAFVRWEETSGSGRRGVLAALVVFAALQTVLLESLYHIYW